MKDSVKIMRELDRKVRHDIWDIQLIGMLALLVDECHNADIKDIMRDAIDKLLKLTTSEDSNE